MYVSPCWRNRYRDLNLELDDPDSLISRNLDAIVHHEGDADSWGSVWFEEVLFEYHDLLPGEAGRHVLNAILGRQPASPWALGPNFSARNVFKENDRPYKSRRRGRPARDEDDRLNQAILDDLRHATEGLRTFTALPRTYAEISERRNISPREIQKRVYRMRKRLGMKIRTSAEQVAWIEEWLKPSKEGAPDDPARATRGATSFRRCRSCSDWFFEGSEDECHVAWEHHRETKQHLAASKPREPSPESH